MKRKIPIILIVAALVAGVIYYALAGRKSGLVLTGVVTTDEVIANPEIQGRLQKLLVREGDVVTNGQLLAVIESQSQRADLAFYASSEQQYAAQVAQAQASLENARLNFEREKDLYEKKIESVQNYDLARTGYDAAKALVDSLNKQVQAVGAQKDKSQVQLAYTEIRSPINGIVDTRAARQGEVVNPGQAVVTLVDQDDLWARVDVEETYIDGVRLGDKLRVRLPSGAVREGTVFFRGVDAQYATQRDVSRTKRDIKTFEVRIRCDNADRALALGMTVYVDLSLKGR